VAVHLFGFPCDLQSIGRVTHGQGAVLVEDCAQLLDAGRAKDPSGERGDLVLLSFGRGKPVTTLGGGALLCFDPTWEELLNAAAGGIAAPPSRPIRTLAGTACYGILSRSALYRIVEGAPGLGIGVTRFDPRFSVLGLEEARAAVGLALLPRLPSWNQARRCNANALRAALEGTPGVLPVGRRGKEVPLRFPIRVAPDSRTVMLRALKRAGIGASGMYPAALADVPEAEPYVVGGSGPCPGARETARTLLTLPCHPAAANLASLVAEAVADAMRRPPLLRGR
jgi:dTDP-4-amino-4,6-dideoxygalactose transaminase